MKGKLSTTMIVLVLLISMRFLLSSLFIYAGISKLHSLTRFYLSIVTFKLVPLKMAKVLAGIIPLIECGTGLLLFFGVAVKSSAGFIAILLLIFTGAFVHALLGKFEVSCNCFGHQQEQQLTSIPYALIRNALLLCMALLLIISPAAIQQDLLHIQMSLQQAYVEAFILAGGLLLLTALSMQIIKILQAVTSLKQKHRAIDLLS